MRSRMHPRYYLSADIFEREQQKIFHRAWLFAGLKTLLPEHNCFITRTVAGIPVVIQNFHGELHAFENVCLHRSAPLQSGPVGRRPLVCPYHAWKYGASGRVENIPHCDALYRFSECEKQHLKLREFALRCVGNLLFIHVGEDPFPLEDQFAPQFLASLESSSNAYDSEVMTTTWHCRFNWKLAYENLRDANHVAFVHPRTLAPFVRFMPRVDTAQAEASMHPQPDTSAAALRAEMHRFSYGGPEGDPAEFAPFDWHAYVDRWRVSTSGSGPQPATSPTHNQPVSDSRQDDAYFNWLAFPNLHIASGNGGHSFVIEHHVPVAPDHTDVEIYRFTARKKHAYAASAQVLLSEMHHSKLILSEDFGILEKIQSGLHPSAPLPEQGAYESTNRLIERWYATLMETDHGI